MRVRSSKIFRPSSMAMLATTASFVAWLFPSFGFLVKGFNVPSEVTPLGFLVIVCWYSMVFSSLRLGEKFGRHVYGRYKNLVPNISLYSEKLYWLYFLLALVGVSATYEKVLGGLSLDQMIFYVASGYANNLKETLYEDYSAGIVSFRYLAMYVGGFSIYNIFFRKNYSIKFVLGMLLLFSVALLSSRLIFVSSVVLALFLRFYDQKILNIKIFNLVIFFFVAFVLLALLNYTRNSNYYAEGGLYFWGAGASSILTYLGSPFQVVIGVADNVEWITSQGFEAYRRYVDIDETLNSNSAFVAVHEQFGYWAWIYFSSILFFMGAVFAYCEKKGESGYLFLCGAILYASSEIWRLNLFGQGIFIVWFFCGIICPIVVASIGRSRS